MQFTIYRILLTAIFAASVITIMFLRFLEAPYGRYIRTGWGIGLRPRWAWMAMELPSALIMIVLLVFGEGMDPISFFLFLLWEIHYLYRSLIYPFLMRDNGTRNFPIVIILIAVLYNSANAYVNGFHFFSGFHRYDPDWIRDPRFLVGVVLFFLGGFTHIWADRVLRNLRPAGTREYRIPRGGLFDLVSSPNYLGEMVQWCGFALAAWSLAGLSFAVFTIANLLPRAVSHHRWYRSTFPDYPPRRKALIPYIF